MAVIVDSSVWIAYLAGGANRGVENATIAGDLVMSPLVIAEILSGDLAPEARSAFGELLQDYPSHDTPLAHWIAVGELRRMLAKKGVNVTIPDAHVAQCALDLNAMLIAHDDIFTHIAAHTSLRLAQLR